MANRQRRGQRGAASDVETYSMTPDPTENNFVPLPYDRFRNRDLSVPIGFRTQAEMLKFNDFSTRTIEPTRWACGFVMGEQGLDNYDQMESLCAKMGLLKLFKATALTYKNLTCEFLASFKLHKTGPKNGVPFPWVEFQLEGNIHKLSIPIFATILHLPPPAARSTGATQRRSDTEIARTNAFWELITHSSVRYNSSRSKSSAIRNPNMRYLARIIAHSVMPSNDMHYAMSATTLQLVHDAVVDQSYHEIDVVTHLVNYFEKLSNSTRERHTISCGGIITLIGIECGFLPEMHEHVHGDTVIGVRALSSFHYHGRILLDDITETRAIALPNFQRYDLDDQDTWGMPLGEGEFTKHPERGWEPAHYQLIPGRLTFEEDQIGLRDRYEERREEMNTGREENVNYADLEGFAQRLAHSHGASTSANAGPSNQYFQQQQPEVPQNVPWYQQDPYRNAFDPTYVHPSITELQNDVRGLRTHIDERFDRLESRFDTSTQGSTNQYNSLTEQMGGLSMQQANYLNPMFVNQLGYTPPDYDYNRPTWGPPDDWTFDNRIQWPGPNWRPPHNQQ